MQAYALEEHMHQKGVGKMTTFCLFMCSYGIYLFPLICVLPHSLYLSHIFLLLVSENIFPDIHFTAHYKNREIQKLKKHIPLIYDFQNRPIR